MAIHKTGRRLFKFIRIPKVQRSLNNKGGRSVVANLNLTAMIDMFTVLVTFLMMMFNATGEILSQDKDIKMPKALNNKDLERAILIQISAATTKVEGEAVVATHDLLSDKASDDDVTKGLQDKLKKKREDMKRQSPDKEPSHEVIIQADSFVPYHAIKRVMMACAKNGFEKINLAVEGKSPAE